MSLLTHKWLALLKYPLLLRTFVSN